MKTCSKCHQTKPITDFHRYNKSRDGYEYRCKKCASVATMQSRLKKSQTVTVTEKVCASCKIRKAVDQFNKNRTTHDGFHDYCKPCFSIINKKSRKKHPKTIKARDKRHYEKHRERLLAEARIRNKKRYNKKKQDEIKDGRICKECHEKKPLNQFPKGRKGVNGSISRTCKVCSDVLYPKPTTKTCKKCKATKLLKHFYKSGKKYQNVCKPCSLKQNSDYMKTHTEKAHAKTRKYRARKNGATIVDSPTLEEIAIRDNWICHICLKKVTRKTWSMDHHFPVSKPNCIHGRQYVSLSHRSCNSKRRDGKLPAQLHLIDFAYDMRPPNS